MPDELLVRHCAPTLAGIKTGSLFSCEYTDRESLRRELSRLNKVLVPKGLRVLLLREGQHRALIYCYRPGMLRRDLTGCAASAILEQCGYEARTPEACVCRLAGRLRAREEFPHEIGLFLGYPAEDVRGFMENEGQCCKYCGCWKVYGDVEQAKKTFHSYRLCTQNMLRQFSGGSTVDELTVAAEGKRTN